MGRPRFPQLASRSRAAPKSTLEEYLPSRIIDAEELIWYGTITFGMGRTLPDDELGLCMELARPRYAATSLTNDLYSWRKERKAAGDAGINYVYNAVWVIMQKRSVCEEDAIAVGTAEIQKYIAKYDRIVESVKMALALSLDT